MVVRRTTVTLLQARVNTGLSREKAAVGAGISSKTLERWEKDPAKAKRYVVDRLAGLYGVHPDAITLEAAA